MTERYKPLGGLWKLLTKDRKANHEAISQMSVVDNFKTQLDPSHRDQRIDRLATNVEGVVSGVDLDQKQAIKLRQDKICEVIAIMRMATTDTWLKQRELRPAGKESFQTASKTREEIADQVCKTLLTEAISDTDFSRLYNETFGGGDRAERQIQQQMSPDRRILLIKVTEQFSAYAKAHPENEIAKTRSELALRAVSAIAEGQLFDGLPQAHISEARSAATSVLATTDVKRFKRPIESYFQAPRINSLEKFQVANDIRLENLGQTKATADLFNKIPVTRAGQRILASLLTKIEAGLHLDPTDKDILATKPTLTIDNRPDLEFIQDERENSRQFILAEIKAKVLATACPNKLATRALKVLSGIFPSEPALVLAKETSFGSFDNFRGSSVAGMSVEMIKAIPDFLLKPRGVSTAEASHRTSLEITLAKLGLLKETLAPAHLNQALTFLRQGYYELKFHPVVSRELNQMRILAYFEMIIDLNTQLPKNDRISLFGTLAEFTDGARDIALPAMIPRLTNLARKLVA